MAFYWENVNSGEVLQGMAALFFYYINHTKHIKTLCRINGDSLNATAGYIQ